MKKLYLFLALLLLLPLITISQIDPNKIFEPQFTHEIEAALKDGKLRKGRAATYYSNIDEYEKSLEKLDVPINWQLDTMTLEKRATFLQFQPRNAIDYLQKRTKNEQIVIISEAHQKPQHRIFTAKMLTSLYANGFRHLGIETLSPDFMETDSLHFMFDADLNQRGYALYKTKTGTYTLEPQMSNMIRTALRLGFKLFAYERISREKDRDLQQALNIIRYMKKHPTEKVVIHCGWYHAIESSLLK